MRVTVVGTGHVGLVTCASLAALGHEVVGTDADGEKIAQLQRGLSPFFEPGLDELVREGVASGRLNFTSEMAEAVPGAEVIFISVGTPPKVDGEANLIAVESVAREVARHATVEGVLVEKSTVPAGTGARLRRAMRHESGAHLLEVASNPEFLSEGTAVRDAMEPQRILVGADSERAFQAMRRLYAPLVERGTPLIETDVETAELAKYVCNAFLALKVSFINAVARVCERTGADVVDVADVMGADPRIGRSFLNAGLGFGGSCFPKDVRAFQRLVGRLGYEFPLLDEVVRVNEESLEATLEKVREALWNVEGKRVAVLGLSYKPGTDDVRFSPAMVLVQRLLSEGATVVAYDPHALSNAKAEVPEIEVATDPYDAAEGAHCLVICTEWDEFHRLDVERIARAMAHPLIVDGRNVLDPAVVGAAGLSYFPTGRPMVVR
ncbi:MAG TPA: UDP-glucose/GDP-mannose dehydrogenase family protein [Actinomycetota bacterium]